MLEALKDDGYMVIAARFSYLGEYWYSDVLEKLEKDKRIRFVKSEDFFKYDQLSEVVGKFARTPCRVIVYKKIDPNSAIKQSKLQRMSTRQASVFQGEGSPKLF